LANPEHVELLKNGVKERSAWRNVALDLSHAELSHASLSGANLSGANLIKTSLSGANLTEANLSNANLSNANLTGANLCGADLIDADLSSADLSGADLGRVEMKEADLSNASLIDADLSDANLTGANLTSADLSHANLSKAKLSNANLNSANLRGAGLTGTDLNDAEMPGAILRGADLRGANLIRANLGSADLVRADLSQAILHGANLSDANLRGANLGSADLLRANLRGAELFQAKLYGANLSDADLRGADLTAAKLRGADLFRADLRGTDLTGANLIRANLICTNLRDANLRDANLRRANLRGADLRCARLVGAKLAENNLTECRLWETQRSGWSITRIVCESAYWDQEGKKLTIYKPGEFERLHADKTKIKLFYKDGISPIEIAMLPDLIRHLESIHPGTELRLSRVQQDAGGAVVELVLDYAAIPVGQLAQLKAALESEANERIRYQQLALEEKELRIRIEGAKDALDSIVRDSLRRVGPPAQIQQQVNIMRDQYNNAGQAGAMGPDAHVHDVTFTQNQLQVDLTKLAPELAQLLQAMKTEADTPDQYIALAEVAKAEQAAKAGDSHKVAGYLKAAGQWALDTAVKIGAPVAAEALKKVVGG
jgi:uncharacterized protein YjbI with pentapeptide repeats